MQFNILHAANILARTPAVLAALLKDLPEEWTKSNEGAQTWSPHEVLAHLIVGEETDWLPRTTKFLRNDPEYVLEPFDMAAHHLLAEEKSTNELLVAFSRARRSRIEELHAMDLSAEQLNYKAVHPEFGVVSLQNHLSAWVVHDQGHIAQITRTMAKQYTSEVGPWTEYMTVLKDRVQ